MVRQDDVLGAGVTVGIAADYFNGWIEWFAGAAQPYIVLIGFAFLLWRFGWSIYDRLFGVPTE